jgi:hypothetical protein
VISKNSVSVEVVPVFTAVTKVVAIGVLCATLVAATVVAVVFAAILGFLLN